MTPNSKPNFIVVKKSTDTSVDSFKFSWLGIQDVNQTLYEEFDNFDVSVALEVFGDNSPDEYD